MKIRMLLATAVVLGAIGAPLRAQDTAGTKPGGLNKVAHNVSKTMKKAGRDTKAEVHRDASKRRLERRVDRGGRFPPQRVAQPSRGVERPCLCHDLAAGSRCWIRNLL